VVAPLFHPIMRVFSAIIFLADAFLKRFVFIVSSFLPLGIMVSSS